MSEPLFEWRDLTTWTEPAERDVTVQVEGNSTMDDLALTFIIGGGRYDLDDADVNAGTPRPAREFGRFDLADVLDMVAEFTDVTTSTTWTWPDASHIHREEFNGTDGRGDWAGWRWSFNDSGSDSDFNDLVVAVKAYADEPVEGLDYYRDDDRTDGLVSWTITYGRVDANSKPTPVTATVLLAQEVAGDCPETGDAFRLSLEDDDLDLGEAAVRFTGEVTDPEYDQERGLHTLVAAGRHARASRRSLRTTGWPPELDGPRVARILGRTVGETDLGTIDPGTETIRAGDSTITTVGTLLETVMDSTLGQAVEQRTGEVDWHDAERRRGSTPVLTLGAHEIRNGLRWAQHIGDVLNDLAVSYAGGTVRVTDPTSIDEYEAFPAQVSTALRNASDAHSLGLTIVGRRAEPVWQLPVLVVDLWRYDATEDQGVSPAKRAALLALEFGDRLEINGLPAGSPFDASVEVFVEGIRETAYRVNGGLVWRLELSVSDPRLTGVTVRWKDVDDLLSWEDVDPELTWLDLAQIEDPALLGLVAVDGGDPETTDFEDVLDGGTYATTAWDTTLDGEGP